MEYLVDAALGLAVAILVYVTARAITFNRRRELRSAAVIELEEIRSQEGYNSVSFLGGRGRRSSKVMEEERKELELKGGTASGRELEMLERLILSISLTTFIVVTVTIIVGRYIYGV